MPRGGVPGTGMPRGGVRGPAAASAKVAPRGMRGGSWLRANQPGETSSPSPEATSPGMSGAAASGEPGVPDEPDEAGEPGGPGSVGGPAAPGGSAAGPRTVG
ncbi:hypothetical protein [Streptodolium elevatio]